jgi:hypothetical protein
MVLQPTLRVPHPRYDKQKMCHNTLEKTAVVTSIVIGIFLCVPIVMIAIAHVVCFFRQKRTRRQKSEHRLRELLRQIEEHSKAVEAMRQRKNLPSFR